MRIIVYIGLLLTLIQCGGIDKQGESIALGEGSVDTVFVQSALNYLIELIKDQPHDYLPEYSVEDNSDSFFRCFSFYSDSCVYTPLILSQINYGFDSTVYNQLKGKTGKIIEFTVDISGVSNWKKVNRSSSLRRRNMTIINDGEMMEFFEDDECYFIRASEILFTDEFVFSEFIIDTYLGSRGRTISILMNRADAKVIDISTRGIVP